MNAATTFEPFVDYYALLEIDLSADPKDIEKQFFELGQKWHPNVPATGDPEKFDLLTKAFQTLRVPETREQYDDLYIENMDGNAESDHAVEEEVVPDNSDATMENMDLEKEAQDRVIIMKQFYERRRTSPGNPGLAAGSLDSVVQCSESMLDFQLWYCHAKGWLYREESGQLSITAQGVDHVEAGLREFES